GGAVGRTRRSGGRAGVGDGRGARGVGGGRRRRRQRGRGLGAARLHVDQPAGGQPREQEDAAPAEGADRGRRERAGGLEVRRGASGAGGSGGARRQRRRAAQVGGRAAGDGLVGARLLVEDQVVP